MLEKLFGFVKGEHSVRTEVLAGLTTFLTMSYILAVNPDIFSALPDMPGGSVFTATALAAIIGTLVMSIYAKMPFALAPGMGLNAFFVYTICLTMGYSWQFALTAVFLEGIIFIILTITNIRQIIVDVIPVNLRIAIGCGIGLFIAFIGLSKAGIIIDNQATLVSLGDLTAPAASLCILGVLLIGVLLYFKVPGALLIGILVITVAGIPFKLTTINGIVALPQSISPIFCKFEWSHIFSLDMLMIVFTFLFLDLFDTLGTLIGVCTKANMMNEKGEIPNLNKAFMADSIATTASALLGTSTTTTYVESAAGVTQGGRTGLTSFVTACCFALALFFSPLFLAIPSCATAPVLIVVGVMMMSPIVKVDFTDYTEAIPAFITIIMMPLAYSVSDGILLGVISYVLLNVCTGQFKKLSPAIYVLALLFVLRYIFL